jgi:ELWxxDGT repeat protein
MELWKSNGTNGGTVKVMEIYPGNTQGCDAEYFSLALNKVFFTANDPVNGRELWVMDNATSTGLNEILSLNDFRVYPNPSDGYINLDYQFIRSGKFQCHYFIERYSMAGLIFES